MARINWTPENDGYVDRRLGEGASYAVIGGELGISAGAIAGRLFRRRAETCSGAPQDGAVPTLEQDRRVTQGGCRWVIGDPGAVWHWCGKPIAEGPYCAEHATLSVIRRPKGESKR